jgi:hypothetical protein
MTKNSNNPFALTSLSIYLVWQCALSSISSLVLLLRRTSCDTFTVVLRVGAHGGGGLAPLNPAFESLSLTFCTVHCVWYHWLCVLARAVSGMPVQNNTAPAAASWYVRPLLYLALITFF